MTDQINNLIDDLAMKNFAQADKTFKELLEERIAAGLAIMEQNVQKELVASYPSIFSQIQEDMDQSPFDEHIKDDVAPVEESDISEPIPEATDADGSRPADHSTEEESASVYESSGHAADTVAAENDPNVPDIVIGEESEDEDVTEDEE